MKKIEHILVATDLSESSALAYRAAAGLALRLGARISLLHVDEVSQYGFHSSAELNTYLGRISEARDLLLGNAQETFARFGLNAEVIKLSGDPVEHILEQARQPGVDLLVMAKRGLRSIRRLILGGTSKRVLRRVSIPTLILPATVPEGGVPAEPPVYRRLLAATDFSQTSKWGLYATLELAEMLDAKVEYVHVLRLPIPVPALPGEAPLLVPRETSDRVREALSTDLSHVIGEDGARRCSPSVIVGASVGQSISEMAQQEDVDLITLPSHGRSGMQAVLFGSTAENVIKLSSVPVLVFPADYLVERFREESEQ